MTGSLHTLTEIDRRIRALTGEHPESRPFVCTGSPVGCAVAEIGINPGTPTPFWNHWSVESGFNKTAWLQEYIRLHGKYGPTRRNIDLFCESLQTVRCIELNLYDRFSPRSADLPQSLRRTDVLDAMLQLVKPRLVLIHGEAPAGHLSQLLNVQLKKDAFVKVRYRGNELEVLQAKCHFMKASKEYVRQLAETFAKRAAA
jgi:hypothetical protein